MLFSQLQTLPGFDELVELDAASEGAWYRAREAGEFVLLRVAASEIAQASLDREMDFHESHAGAIPADALSSLVPLLRLLKHGDLLVGVYENREGVPVGSILQSSKFDLNSFLGAALATTALLNMLHAAGLAYGSALAENLFYESAHSHTALAGLGRASDPDPETDLYNLGVLLYRMISGRAPKQDVEPLHRLYPGFPEVLSKMILKLLGRESPYQSAAGLYPDLQSCAQQLEVFKTIEDFEPGRMDRPLSHA